MSQPASAPDQPDQGAKPEAGQPEAGEPEASPAEEAGQAEASPAEEASQQAASPPQRPELAPPGPPLAAPPPPPVPPKSPPKRRTGLKIGLAVAAVLVVLCVAGGFFLASNLRGEIPQTGDCLTDAADASDMELVGCDAGGAAWTVLGSHGVMSQRDFNALAENEVCQDYQGTERALWVTESYFFVSDSTSGEVVCLQRLG